MGHVELKPHQEVGIEWLQRVRRGLLADSPRSGKTAELLLAASGRTLVVAPPFLEGTWKEQRKLWRPDFDFTFCGYNSVARRAPNSKGHMLLTEPWPRQALLGDWDTVICDESHNLLNPKADWTQAVSRLHYDRLYLATGTPVTHWVHQLLVTLRLLYPGDKRFTNRRKWLEKWFKMSPNHFSGSLEPYVPKNDPNNGLLDKHTWAQFWMENGLDGPEGRMLQREVDLGVPTTEQVIECKMTAKQEKFYKELKKDYVAWLPSGGEVSAWSDGGLHTKLLQCSTGLETLEDSSGRGAWGSGSGKIAVLRELLPESRRSPTLLFCHFRKTATMLAELCTRLDLKYGVIMGGTDKNERDRLRHSFQNGELDVLVGTLSTVAVGLTLSRASTEIFVEHSFTPSKNEQARMRAMELGKASSVHVIDLYTSKTVDIGMRRLLKGKTDQQVQALTAREYRSVIDG